MAIYLKNSAFIHIPKCGGNWITNMIIAHVKHHSVTNKKSHILVAHETPPIDRPVFCLVREPAEFANSLFWQRKTATVRRYGYIKWDERYDLEKACKSDDYHTFLKNVADLKNGIENYYKCWYGKYNNVVIGKMENMCEDFICFLKDNNEEFDEDKIRLNAETFYNKNKKKKMIDPVYRTDINNANKNFCKQFNYKVDIEK